MMVRQVGRDYPCLSIEEVVGLDVNCFLQMTEGSAEPVKCSGSEWEMFKQIFDTSDFIRSATRVIYVGSKFGIPDRFSTEYRAAAERVVLLCNPRTDFSDLRDRKSDDGKPLPPILELSLLKSADWYRWVIPDSEWDNIVGMYRMYLRSSSIDGRISEEVMNLPPRSKSSLMEASAAAARLSRDSRRL